MDVLIRLNSEDYPGTVTAISPEVVRGEVTVRIRFAGDLPPSLRQNQRLTARIQLEHRPNVLMVQRGPFFDDFRGFVLTLDGDRTHRRPVVLGGRSLGHIEIMEGVDEGDTVIVSALDISHSDKNILVTR
jgi:HlyD family secretion protein